MLPRLGSRLMDHPETKFSCDKEASGPLPRRHVVLNYKSVRYIGKETNDLEESEIVAVTDDNYTEYIDQRKIQWSDVIDSITPDLAAIACISRRNLSYMKRAVKQGLPLRMKPATKQKLLKVYMRRV